MDNCTEKEKRMTTWMHTVGLSHIMIPIRPVVIIMFFIICCSMWLLFMNKSGRGTLLSVLLHQEWLLLEKQLRQ